MRMAIGYVNKKKVARMIKKLLIVSLLWLSANSIYGEETDQAIPSQSNVNIGLIKFTGPIQPDGIEIVLKKSMTTLKISVSRQS